MKKRPKKKTKTVMKSKPPKGARHFVEYVALGGHSDAYKCICGWQSEGYWDFAEAAWDEWLLHAFDTKTEVRPKDCDRQAKIVIARKNQLERLQNERDHLDRRIAKLKPSKPRKKKK